MALQPEQVFVRQHNPALSRVAMVVPSTAVMLPDVRTRVQQIYGESDIPRATEPPHRFTFHYIPAPIEDRLLRDGAEVDNGVYKFTVRDAVLGIFDLSIISYDEIPWSFSSTSQQMVLAAIRIGETLDVRFEEPFDKVLNIQRYHIPPGVPESGYGKYPVQLTVDSLSPNGFRVVSSFEPGSATTESRLPFFFGFRVYGVRKGDCEFPLWRDLLAHAIRESLTGNWHHSLLFSAFSLESMIDQQLATRLVQAAIGEDYIKHVLQVADRRYELHALNTTSQKRLSKTQVNKTAEKLNSRVFTPRNQLAHGKRTASAISSADSIDAIRATVEFIWDWFPEERRWLVTEVRPFSWDALIDEDLIASCTRDS